MTKKRCNDPDHEGPRYLPVENFHKQGFRGGKQQFSSRCKECKNRYFRAQYVANNRQQGPEWPNDKKRAYSRARSRALTKLSRTVPELYATLLQEELDCETEFDFSSRGSVRKKLF